MGGSTNERVPAWKLRQQQRQRQVKNDLSVSLKNGDELGGPRRPRGGDLDQKPNGTTRVPAWKLREQMKRKGGSTGGSFDELSVASGDSRFSYQSRATVTSTTSSQQRAVSMVPEDPNLPPAFRAINKLQARKRNDFNSLCSVHSRSVTSRSRANGSRIDGRSAANSYAKSYGDHHAFEFLESESDESSSFDGEGSFASLDSDADEDDEAYRQSRNQMARMTIETQKQPKDSKRGGKSRFKKMGTSLDFIAE